MRILGLDPAWKCGWAVLENGAVTHGGVWQLASKRDSADQKLLDLDCYVERALRVFGPFDVVSYESADHVAIDGAQWSIQRRSEMIGVIRLRCAWEGARYMAWAPARIKRLAVGDGVAGKGKMMAAARRKWPGVEWVDDNHVDAAWAAWVASETIKKNEGILERSASLLVGLDHELRVTHT